MKSSTVAGLMELALGEYDAVVAACPAKRMHLGERACPKCKAMSDEGCREEGRAAYAFICKVRAALRARASLIEEERS